MRRALFNDDRLLSSLLDAILYTFDNVVTPWWAVRTIPLSISEKHATNLTLLIEKPLDMNRRLQAYIAWEKKQANEKII